MTTISTLKKALAGDRLAQEQLFMAHYADVRIFVAARLHGHVIEADEITQATFVAAFRSLHTYAGSGSFAAWLRGIAQRQIARHFRDRKRHVPIGDELDDVLLAQVGDMDQPSDPRSAYIEACMQALSPQARKLAQRRFMAP